VAFLDENPLFVEDEDMREILTMKRLIRLIEQTIPRKCMQ
jgi:hypothetical protein